LWGQAINRLSAIQARQPGAWAALGRAWRIALEGGEEFTPSYPEELVLALTEGSVAVFPGKGCEAPVVTPATQLAPPPVELLSRHSAVIVVRGPEQCLAYRAALDWVIRSAISGSIQ